MHPLNASVFQTDKFQQDLTNTAHFAVLNTTHELLLALILRLPWYTPNSLYRSPVYTDCIYEVLKLRDANDSLKVTQFLYKKA